MDASGDKRKECQVIIGFENNFLKDGVAVTPLNMFSRDAKFLTFESQTVTIPSGHVALFSEVHFGIIISKETSEVTKDNALDFVNGYVVVLNSRLPDDEYRKSDDSYTFSEITDFKDAIIISNIITKDIIQYPNAATIWAMLNGKEVQRASLSEARMSVEEMIDKASQLKALRAGDLILSGTPSGAFYVKAGAKIEIGIDTFIRTEISVQKQPEEAKEISTKDQSVSC